VLVVDDEELVGRVLVRALGTVAEVDVVVCGTDALDRILGERDAGRPFDLVICDVMMPGMSGPDLFERVKEADRRSADAFVFVTGGASDKERAKVQATGAPCLQKPLDVEAIMALLGR
jgi:two-component system, NtrC family, sensor kinase